MSTWSTTYRDTMSPQHSILSGRRIFKKPAPILAADEVEPAGATTTVIHREMSPIHAPVSARSYYTTPAHQSSTSSYEPLRDAWHENGKLSEKLAENTYNFRYIMKKLQHLEEKYYHLKRENSVLKQQSDKEAMYKEKNDNMQHELNSLRDENRNLRDRIKSLEKIASYDERPVHSYARTSKRFERPSLVGYPKFEDVTATEEYTTRVPPSHALGYVGSSHVY